MSEQDTNKEIKTEAVVETTPAAATVPADKQPAKFEAGKARPKREFKKNKRKTDKRKERVKSEFDQKMLNIRRVTRVASGGRRFTFSVAMVIGNKKGKVGVGIGKAGDTTLAIDKAVKNAKKNMIDVKRTKYNSIAHEVKIKYSSAIVMIMPAKGRGLVAGSAVRDVLDLAGVTDVNAKILSGSKNKLNIARATVNALETLKK